MRCTAHAYGVLFTWPRKVGHIGHCGPVSDTHGDGLTGRDWSLMVTRREVASMEWLFLFVLLLFLTRNSR
jgi:hypothetical protein